MASIYRIRHCAMQNLDQDSCILVSLSGAPFFLGSQLGRAPDKVLRPPFVVLEYPSTLGYASVNNILQNILARSRCLLFLYVLCRMKRFFI